MEAHHWRGVGEQGAVAAVLRSLSESRMQEQATLAAAAAAIAAASGGLAYKHVEKAGLLQMTSDVSYGGVVNDVKEEKEGIPHPAPMIAPTPSLSVVLPPPSLVSLSNS